MNKVDQTKNCHEYCRWGKQCRYMDGENGLDPAMCAMYWKINGIMTDSIQEKKRYEEGEDWE